jgi:hypothetical protein
MVEGVVTGLPAARSAKVMGPNLNWAVVCQILATKPGLRHFVHVLSSQMSRLHNLLTHVLHLL